MKSLGAAATAGRRQRWGLNPGPSSSNCSAFSPQRRVEERRQHPDTQGKPERRLPLLHTLSPQEAKGCPSQPALPRQREGGGAGRFQSRLAQGSPREVMFIKCLLEERQREGKCGQRPHPSPGRTFAQEGGLRPPAVRTPAPPPPAGKRGAGPVAAMSGHAWERETGKTTG